MKLIDKLKNMFFEEVEVDEDEEELPKTYAKKVEIPKKNVETPKKEEYTVRDTTMDITPVIEETKEVFEEKKEEPIVENKEFPMMFDDDDFLEDTASDLHKIDSEPVSYHREERKLPEEKELYHGKKEMSYVESVNKPNYSYTKSYYEEKETKGFRPSPIISPIYGILDKNYKSEEVVTKRETRIVSNYNKPDLDSVRNKAFGSDEKEPVVENHKTKTYDKEDKKVYDVNSNKPQVNRVTIADADEYYNDLGLAYNVDYSDASRTNETRSSKYNNKDKRKNKNNDNDNLFDLIDSMYNKED